MGRFRPTKVTAAQRRYLTLVAEHSLDQFPWSATSVRKPTLDKLLALGYVEITKRPPLTWDVVLVTDAGRKYLTNYSKAYGSGVDWSRNA